MIQSCLQEIRNVMRNPRKLTAIALGFSGTVMLTSVVVTGLVAVVRGLGGLEGFELSAYDSFMRLRPAAGVDERLLVVGISEEDIQTRQEFPIHDGTLAEALEKLDALQPRAIGLDIARDVPQGDGRDRLLRVVQNSERLIVGCKLSSAGEPGIPPAPGTPVERTAFTDFRQDNRGIIRRSILISTPTPSSVPLPTQHPCNEVSPENQMLSLSFSLAVKYLAAENIPLEPANEREVRLGSVVLHPMGPRVVGYHNTQAEDYQILLNYRAAEGAVRQVTLTDVLENRVDPTWVRDRLVLVGYTAKLSKDVFFTPFSVGDRDELSMPGVVIHAQSASQILSAVLNGRPLIWYWSGGVEWMWMLGWALVGGFLAWVVRNPLWFIVSQGGAILLLLGSCFLLFLVGGWVPLVPPAIALVISASSVVLLDRANKGGYTQAIYEQVKEQVQGALKPTIEIDQDKRQREVEEITQSTYFQDLITRAREIREKRQREEEQ